MRSGAAFSRGGVLALVVGGFALFLAALYLIGAGEDFGGTRGQGQAHAASNGLNGYAGLVRLVEAANYDVARSRSPQGLETSGLLVLTPPAFGDGEAIAEILENRTFLGPTLVILPKWFATPPSDQLPSEARDKFKRGWVILNGAEATEWPEDLPKPYRFTHELAEDDESAAGDRWSGLDLAGRLPTSATMYAVPEAAHEVLLADAEGRTLAFWVNPGEGIDDENPAYPVVFLVEPDLANNYGLADANRAAAAVALVDWLANDADIYEVTFDMTLNGFGASENLLTLAFRPPFLAATLSLLVALLIVGWRAFQRFGPPAAPAGPDIAFGKRQLIANGAGLILRARRFGLLGAPYAALSARRLAERLGLVRPDPQSIDEALARRLPQEEPFTRRAARLEAAAKPADILAAAQSLDDLNAKLSQGQ
ncbi:DUF4350 domain-containing protein [Porphyrobacter sp. SLTP]|uniref:DUF4350 domain-containing protein n=1 Tax=Porphyrobacter sp. SLTP TaxID=2683266 RepID=UPI001412B36E|nr:DUF4350 domain-containing protein [Porphyrobacter sp. SLTP]NBB25885.1 DUF4350 domain-containing protein [Porphyrobacter sp. SLTP]